MAFMSQERKAKIAPTVNSVLKKYGVKGSLSVRNHMSLVLSIKSGPIDFVENFIETDKNKPYANHMSNEQVAFIRKNQSVDVNVYWYKEHFSGPARKFLNEVICAMNDGNHDNSDVQTDYFDVGWYIDINIGQWNKPYVVVK
jgi:hypothetical protein